MVNLVEFGGGRHVDQTVNMDDIVPPQTFKWYQFWAKRKHTNRIKEERTKLIKAVTPEELLHALSGTGTDFRGQANLAWQTFAIGGGFSLGIDFAQFFLPGGPLTLELSGEVKGAVGKHTLVVTYVTGHKRGSTPLPATPFGQMAPWLAHDDYLILGLMSGVYKEISTGIGLEVGLDAAKMVPGVESLESVGFGVEAKATASAGASWKGLGYQVCDRTPFFFRDEENSSTHRRVATTLKTLLDNPKAPRPGATYSYVSEGIIWDSNKTKDQPYNPLCSLNYWQSEKAAEAKVEASLGAGWSADHKGKKGDIGGGVKVGASASAGVKGSSMCATYRLQLGDRKGMVMTQDTVITYKQIVAEVGAVVNGGLSVSGGLDQRGDDGKREHNSEADPLSLEKEWKKEWSSNSMCYRSAVSYWLLRKKPGLDSYDKDIAKGKQLAFYDALFPSALLPGTGLQVGQSAALPLLVDYLDMVMLEQADLAEDSYDPKRLRALRSWGINLANSLHITRADLHSFFLSAESAIRDLSQDPAASPDALLIEANFNLPSAEQTREAMKGGRWKSGFPSSSAEVTHSTSHKLGEGFLDSKRKGRFKALKDLTAEFERELATVSGPMDKLTAEFISPKKQRPVYTNLQCIRLRYRLGDRANSNVEFKLGLNLAVVKLGISLKKIDEAGCDGIFDVHTQWFGSWDNGRNESQQVWPTPACVVITPGGGE